MEEGSLRCDANVSVRLRGAETVRDQGRSKKRESFPLHSQKALEYEIERQIGVLESGGESCRRRGCGTRAKAAPYSMRSKEQAHDYRYFPEPDLLPVHVGAAWQQEVRGDLPELPEAKRARLIKDYGITPYDAEVLATNAVLADYFETATKARGVREKYRELDADGIATQVERLREKD